MTTMHNQFESNLKQYQDLILKSLKNYMHFNDSDSNTVIAAMTYSLFAKSKFVRPILCLMANKACGGGMQENVLSMACAIEMIHTYSLIHDDLPAMDDSNTRRGQASCHVKFNDAVAILAGDALLAQALQIVSQCWQWCTPQEAMRQLQAISFLSHAAGPKGLVAGQIMDLESMGKELSLSELDKLNYKKTGELIKASVVCGAILANADEIARQNLTDFGKNIGLAFQVVDDILDMEGDATVVGKDIGQDAKNGKNTYAMQLGVPCAKDRARELTQAALNNISHMDEKADDLRLYAEYLIERNL